MNLILCSALLGIVMMFSGLFLKTKSASRSVAIAGTLLLLAVNTMELFGISFFNSDFNGMLSYERFGYLFLTLILISLLSYFLLSGDDVIAVGNHPYEYFALIFFIIAGVGLVSFYNNLLILFLGVEIISGLHHKIHRDEWGLRGTPLSESSHENTKRGGYQRTYPPRTSIETTMNLIGALGATVENRARNLGVLRVLSIYRAALVGGCLEKGSELLG